MFGSQTKYEAAMQVALQSCLTFAQGLSTWQLQPAVCPPGKNVWFGFHFCVFGFTISMFIFILLNGWPLGFSLLLSNRHIN